MPVYIQVALFFFLFMLLHEAGHVMAAKCLGLRIKKIGFQTKPYPHFFFLLAKTNYEKNSYLFAGMFITVFLFIVALSFNFFSLQGLLLALIIQITLETNPFYSDVTIALVSSRKKIKYGPSYGADYKKEFSNYQFSTYWYLHFVLWTALIVLLTQLTISS